MDEIRPTEERTVEYPIVALGRRRFLVAVAAICDSHDVTWEWDLVGFPGMRNVEVIFRGGRGELDAVERDIAAWRVTEQSYWSSGGSDGAF